MGLVINTNTSGIKSSNTLSRNERKTQRSMAKLASGIKINRAADDASGLAISNKMRNQIAVLDVDVDNCEDGSNMLQVADGAMAEVGEMLIRCSVLAGRATNGIYGDEEREIIQDEIDELHEEIERIQLTTNFNGIQIFDDGKEPSNKMGVPPWAKFDKSSESSETLANTYTDANNGKHAATIIDISNFDSDGVKSAIGKGFSTTCCSCKNFYCIEFTDDNNGSVTNLGGQNYLLKVGLNGAQSAQDVYDRIKNQITTTPDYEGGNTNALKLPNGSAHYTSVEFDGQNLIIFDQRSKSERTPDPSQGYGLMKPGIYTGKPPKEPTYIDLKIGETSTKADKLKVERPSVSTKYLGIEDVFVLTQDEALAARTAYKAAAEVVSDERGKIGAYQNRLDHTINVHTATVENTTAAKSRVEDTDMAKEYTEYTSNNILTQAAQAMLAQAKTDPQNVLNLLQPGGQ